MKYLVPVFLVVLLIAPFLWAQQQSIVVNQRGFNPKRYVEIEQFQDFTVPADNLFVFEGYGFRFPASSSTNFVLGIAIYLDGGLPGAFGNPSGVRPNYYNVRGSSSGNQAVLPIRGITVQPGTVIEISCAPYDNTDDCGCSTIASNCEPTLVAWGYLERL